MTSRDLSVIADEVARGLSYARSSGTSAFITTPIMYANGTRVVVRIDEMEDGYFVSDDGQGALTAELMGALPTFNRLAGNVAQNYGVEFDQRFFFVLKVTASQLVGACSIIANVSAHAIERTIFALDQVKAKRSRETFQSRLHEAFGKRIRFDASLKGASKAWEVDALVLRTDGGQSAFEFVSPAFSAVASAHMKFTDLRKAHDEMHAVAALADYTKTEAPLRAILASSVDHVIAADDAPEKYALAA